MGGSSKRQTAVGRSLSHLVSIWPALPFMGFGFCAAWFELANGTAWLSPVESSGKALINLVVVSDVAMGALLLLVRLAKGEVKASLGRLIGGKGAPAAGAGLAATGSLALILIGPAYLQGALGSAAHPVFQAASCLIGAGFGVLYLRLGMLYSRLPLRRAILYLCYSHLLSAFVYLAAQASPYWAPPTGGPSVPVIVLFVALPLLVGATLALDPAGNPWYDNPKRPACGEGPAEERPAVEGGRGGEVDATRQLRRSALCFAAVLLLFSLVQSAVCSSITYSVAPSITLGSSNLVALLHIPVLLVLAMCASTLEARRLNFSRLCVALVVALELLIVVSLVVTIADGAWVASVRSIAFAFELLMWCLFIAAANRKQDLGLDAIALNLGIYQLGAGIGTGLGAGWLGLADPHALLIACAAALLPTFLLLSERNVDGLYWDEAGAVPSMEAALGEQLPRAPFRAKGSFTVRLNEFAARHGLSARETETLRYLVAGRGDAQIADLLGISYNTARTHVRNVYVKLGIHDRQTLIDVVDEQLR